MAMVTIENDTVPAKLPETEARILETVKSSKEPMHGSQIARAANVATGSVYTLLQRLEKKGLVEKIELVVPFGSTQLKRVVYEAVLDKK